MVYADCKTDYKTTDTFLEIFWHHVAPCPEGEKLHYVIDNLSTHRSYPFCRAVAMLSDMECPSEKELNSLDKRVEWLNAPDKRIVIHLLSVLEGYIYQETLKAA